jgi:DNA-binding PadR family transcriptional regulator
MSLPHAILGFVNLLPMTGYDLKTMAFDKTVAHFWPAVLPQIYRELDKMAAKDWVTSEVQVQTGKPNRKIYSITPAGQAELKRWLAEQQPLANHREAFLIQLFFAAELNEDEILALLKHQREGHEARLKELQQIRVFCDPEGTPAHRRQTLMWLTLDFGLRSEQLYIDWLTDAMEVVKGLEPHTRQSL